VSLNWLFGSGLSIAQLLYIRRKLASPEEGLDIKQMNKRDKVIQDKI
jgi:hypothetical protein